jgi:hypothetical protein
MKNLLLFLFVSASIIACTNKETKTALAESAAPAQAETFDKAAIEAKLMNMEASWVLSALDKDHGVKFIEENLADDFSQFNANGGKQDKSELLKSKAATKETITEVINGDMVLTFYSDNVATIVGSHVTKGKDEAGKVFTKTSFWTDTFMERNGNWQAIASGESNKIVFN